ncbi:hypothetical protein TCON_1827 [Astathelohania contejeani]|uniref:HECT domain-containing protein n=1 Tax=Astathelohania contejeani TaxID=164912 RepID=A0ABQ7HXR9_9MICR|nr:hypothetical protein TCON_1827 [Thelohania contejeani]
MLGIVLGNVLKGNLGKINLPLFIPILRLLQNKILSFEDIKYFDSESYENWYNINYGKNDYISYSGTFINMEAMGVKYEITVNHTGILTRKNYEMQKSVILQRLSEELNMLGVIYLFDGIKMVVDVKLFENLTNVELFLLINGVNDNEYLMHYDRLKKLKVK